MKTNKGKSTHHFRGLLNSTTLSCTLLDFGTILSDYAPYNSLGILKYAIVLESLEATINLFSFPLAQLPVIDFTMTESERAAAVQKVEAAYPGINLKVADNNGVILFEFKCQNFNGIEYFQPLLIPGLAFREFKALSSSYKLIATSQAINQLNLKTGDYIYLEGTMSIYPTLWRPQSYGVGEYGVARIVIPSLGAGQTVTISQAIANTALIDRVAVTNPCRVRCYRDASSAALDLARAIPTQFQQTNISGLNFELNFGTGVDLNGSPVTLLDIYTKSNTILRCTQGTTSYWSITNTDNNPATITISVYFQVLA